MSFLKNRRAVIIIVLCLLFEILISNYAALKVIFGGFERKELDLSQVITEKDDSVELKNGVIFVSDGTLEFRDINTPVANICVTSDCSDGWYKEIQLSMTDGNFAYEDGFEYNKGTFYIYESQGQKSYLSFASYGKAKTIRIHIAGNTVGTLAITSVAVNKPRPFHINILRLICLLAAAFVIVSGIWKLSVSDAKHGYRIIAGAGAAVCVVTCLCGILLTRNPNARLLSKYDPEHMYSDDRYEELFYAFSQGKTSIDVDFDITKFDSLDNLYDRSERNAKDVHGKYWDRAFYNGKFYCYFGAAPIITVYYPVYLLTGSVPTPILVSIILALYAEVFITLLYIKALREMCKDVPLALALLGYGAVLFGSLVLPLAFEFKFYYIAVLSGIGFSALFLYLLLKAYYEKKEKLRLLYLALLGVSAVGIAASRPTLVLYCFMVCVPGMFILRDKTIKTPRKIRYAITMITPVLLGAIVLMIYNYKRFDNPFEFGFNYQVTVSIAKANTVTIDMIPAMIYHFFFQQPDFSTHFPYLHMRSRTLEMYPRYNYNGRLIGILNYPLVPVASLIMFIDRKKDKFRHAFLVSLSAVCMILAFVDMCKAGAHYRYTADILMPLLIIGVVVAFEIAGRIKSVSQKAYNKAYILLAIIFILTFITGFLMMFCNESANLMKSFAFMSRYFYSG